MILLKQKPRHLILEFIEEHGRPLIFGHRGVPLVHQENTMAGFHKAIEQGIDGVEIDVQLLKDGNVVVFHDHETERLTGVKGILSEMNWQEVSKLRIQRSIDLGGGVFKNYPTEERIPLFEEFLEECSGKFFINVELKANRFSVEEQLLGSAVAKVIQKTGKNKDLFFTSFSPLMIQDLKSNLPSAFVGILMDQYDREKCPFPFLQSMGAAVAVFEWSLIIPEFAIIANQSNMALGAFTLFSINQSDYNDSRLNNFESKAGLVRTLYQHGVNYFVTDDPISVAAALFQRSIV